MPKVLGLWLIIFTVRIWQSAAKYDLTSNNGNNNSKAVYQKLIELKEELPKIPKIFSDGPRNCVQIRCKFICVSGKSLHIKNDIDRILQYSGFDCPILEELRLYNYDFPGGLIPRNFLGDLNDRIKSLYIASSDIKDIESGAFANGIFEELAFEDLKLTELRGDLFEGISRDFETLAVIQNDTPLTSVSEGFLDRVHSQLRSLTLQTGMTWLRNMTGNNNFLSNLSRVDLSYNNFGANLQSDSFRTLSIVEYLDLSHSKITVLPEYIFSLLSDTLTYLDISSNQIKVISSKIFDWQKPRNDLRLFAHDNPWNCDCQLHNEMTSIFRHGQHRDGVYCSTPDEYHNWSVFDESLCDENATGQTESDTYPWMPSTLTTRGVPSTSSSSSQISSNDDIPLVCRNRTESLENILLQMKTTLMDFIVVAGPNLLVDIKFKAKIHNLEDYGLIWFSQDTKDIYKMGLDYNKYGIGCYSAISYLTSIYRLLPNVVYTFCVVQKNQTAVSPFNCKSVHIPGNVSVKYAWLTNDHRTTGISLAIFGVILSAFAGIIITFHILKLKPILIKGSKRVATSRSNCNDIIVLPKDRSIEDLRIKEEILSKRASKSNISQTHQRRGSIASSASFQSYMNTNVYEELPVYLSVVSHIIPTVQTDESTSIYGPVFSKENTSGSTTLVSYAEIPFRHKRASNDPLPALPIEDNPDMSFGKLRSINILKHNFDLDAGYAFAYDCMV